jgi:drug/metabolite transporter (DMT)-like permease
LQTETYQGMDQTRKKSVIALLSAAILWSTGGMLVKLINLNPVAIAGYRSMIAAAVVFLFIRKPGFRLTWNKALGAVSYASMVILYVSALKKTTAASAILLQYTAPIYIAMLGGWLLKEKARLRDWIVILFVLAGMVLFFLDEIGSGSMLGNIMAVLAGVAMAMNTIFMRREKAADPLENVFLGCVLTSIVSIPVMIQSVPDGNGWLGLILLGVFQLGFSYVLYAKAIKHISALESTFISLIEPLLNPLWVFLTIGEMPGGLSILGGVIVLTSVTVGCLKPKKPQRMDSAQQQSSL